MMSRNEKLIVRFLSMPSDFHFEELLKLLGYFGYHEVKKGKTSDSRVKFVNNEGIQVLLLKPHPTGILKRYQMKQIKEILGL
jgi:hypothetical protein